MEEEKHLKWWWWWCWRFWRGNKKKMRRSEITELRLGLVKATISIKFVDTSQRKRAFPISLSLSLLLSTLTREGRGIPSTRSWAEHISLIRDSVSNVFTTYGSFFFCFFFALFSIHELPAKNQ